MAPPGPSLPASGSWPQPKRMRNLCLSRTASSDLGTAPTQPRDRLPVTLPHHVLDSSSFHPHGFLADEGRRHGDSTEFVSREVRSPEPQFKLVSQLIILGLCPSEAGAQNLRMLRSRGITHILSVMEVPCESDGTEGDFHRMQIAVQDWPDQVDTSYSYYSKSC